MRKWTETEITSLLDIPYRIIQGHSGAAGRHPCSRPPFLARAA